VGLLDRAGIAQGQQPLRHDRGQSQGVPRVAQRDRDQHRGQADAVAVDLPFQLFHGVPVGMLDDRVRFVAEPVSGCQQFDEHGQVLPGPGRGAGAERPVETARGP
jgi:hypothetical protein